MSAQLLLNMPPVEEYGVMGNEKEPTEEDAVPVDAVLESSMQVDIPVDAVLVDAMVEDAAVEDAAVEDAAVEDAAVEDAAVEDAAVEDAAVEDAAVEYAGGCCVRGFCSG
jgi:hypothetical protein